MAIGPDHPDARHQVQRFVRDTPPTDGARRATHARRSLLVRSSLLWLMNRAMRSVGAVSNSREGAQPSVRPQATKDRGANFDGQFSVGFSTSIRNSELF
jgi:hypothetical protein